MWDNLTLKQKSDVMKMAIQQGISDLNEIKRLYNTSSNQYSDGGYTRWKDAIRAYKGIDPDMDRTYDYEGFYKDNPREAWSMLSKDSSTHFTDKYKTVEHPTFSNQSKYSGIYSKYNPTGLRGGRWDRNKFVMSPDLYRAPVSMDERIDYLSSNEDEGVQLRESDGSLPLLNDGSYWGGVLPNVEVKEPNQLEEYRKFINNGGLSNPISYVLGNREYAEGGPLGNTYKGNGSKSQKMSRWRSSDSIRKRISDWEGASMYSPAPDTGKVNRPFEDEDTAFWNTIPSDIRGKLTQEMADALFSTSYNIGSGNFKKRVVPNLIKLFNGKGTLADVQNSMYGTRDYEPKMVGLRRRRAWERSAFGDAYTKAYGNTPKVVKTPVPTIPSRGTQYNPVELPEMVVTSTETSVNPNPIKKIERFNPFDDNSVSFYNYPIVDIPVYNRHQLITPQIIEYNSTPSSYILFGNAFAEGGTLGILTRALNRYSKYKTTLSKLPNTGGNFITVQQGDTLSGIAKKHGITVNDILSLNPSIKNPDLIKPDDTLKIRPAFKKREVNIREERKQEQNYNNVQAIMSVPHQTNYVLVDKGGKKISVYDRNNHLLYSSSGISTGKSGDDYNTITYVNGKTKKIIDNAGNNSTPAGISYITGIGSYHGLPSFTRGRVNKDGSLEDIASSIHFGNVKDKNSSNGCIRADKNTLKELSKYLSEGCPVYTLPQKEGSRFVARGNKLNFTADNPYGKNSGYTKYWDDYNVYYDKSYDPLKIKYKKTGNVTLDNNRRKYMQAIVNNKKQLQEKFNLSSDEYNRFAEMALGLAEQETKFGTATSYAGKKLIRNVVGDTLMDSVVNPIGRAAKAIKEKRLPHNLFTGASRGYTQIKVSDDNKGMREVYDALNINEGNIDSPEVSALATMARLAYMYNTEVKGRTFKGQDGISVSPWDALLYKWNGKNEELVNNTATPEKNTYINNIKNYASNFGLYREVNEEI